MACAVCDVSFERKDFKRHDCVPGLVIQAAKLTEKLKISEENSKKNEGMAQKVAELTRKLGWSELDLQKIKEEVESYKGLSGPQYELKEC